ncbi:MAG: nuclease family protein, partial [Alphaproteobacteria bacterium]|nr:nuclease family protein [Alphaproteobacteria bacterium]
MIEANDSGVHRSSTGEVRAGAAKFDHASTLPRRNSICDRAKARIYFLAGAGLIKIGVTTNLTSRIRSIRNSSPVPLELLAVIPGNNFTEAGFHQRYASQRRHGEWFDDTPELRQEIERLSPTT